MTKAEAKLVENAEKKRFKGLENVRKNDFAKVQTMDVIDWGVDDDGNTIIIKIGGCILKDWNAELIIDQTMNRLHHPRSMFLLESWKNNHIIYHNVGKQRCH